MASTAIEMLAFNPCRKMMVFGMDLGIESDIETEIAKTIDDENGKRLGLDDEQDKGPVKKRRKQSKPVRIASSESLSDGENFPEDVTLDKRKEDDIKFNGHADNPSFPARSTTPENDTNHFINSEETESKPMNDKDDYPQQSCSQKEMFTLLQKDDNSPLPINLSNTKNSAGFLDSFVGCQVTESSPNQNITKQQASQDTVTSPYQETGFEGGIQTFKKESVFVPSSSSPLSFPSASAKTVGLHVPNSTPHTSSPLRIFNPEAFCDLCNKEFCNKYFLKTHKANKHGIYLDNIGPNVIDALPSLPFINYFSTVNEALPSGSHIPRTVLRKPQATSVPITQQNMSFSVKNNSANGNTRAFCNICQREFCNKYFVRRHKAKIHGIMDTSFPDTPPGDIQDMQKSQNAYDSKISNVNQERYDDQDINSSQFQSRSISSFSISTLNDNENKDDLICVPNKDHISCSEQQTQSIRNERETDSNESTGPGINPLSNNVSSQHSIISNPHQYQHQQYNMDEISKDPIESSDERLKKIGIVNSEAFCDICCKEYCNKYFLRTHKMKSHGILMPDFDKKDDRININENSSSYNNQMMPLNLIIGDHSSEKIDKIFLDTEHRNIFCSFCGQKFKNTFLLKMHVSYMHPQDSLEKSVGTKDNNLQENCEKVLKQKQPFKHDSNLASDNSEKSNTDEEKCFTFDFPNINSKILKCEICHKTFDSASLEMHIETEHANLLEEIGAMGEEDNSNSQLSIVKLDCSSCQKQFTNSGLLEQHVIECHSSNSDQVMMMIMMNQCNNSNMKTVKENEDILKNNQTQNMYSVAEIQTTPTSSFCEICKKELCNKYFMKTHMQRMHGISIENGAHIGGVVCDICNKELCSKYFLRVHKQNSHGIVDEVLGLDVTRIQSPNTDPSLRPSEQNDVNNRYFSHFTEVCTICSRRFRSVKWLKAHLLNDHGDEGKERWKELQVTLEIRQMDKYPKEMHKKSESVNITLGGNASLNSSTNNSDCVLKPNDNYSHRFECSPSQFNGGVDHNINSSVFTSIFNGKNTDSKQYHCSYCPFSTTILAFLFVHERSHGGSTNLLLEQNKKLQCKICSLTFDNYESYEKHSLSHNTTRSTDFTKDNPSEILNKIPPASVSVKQNEILENDHQPKKDAGNFSERFSPVPKENKKCTEAYDAEIFDTNSSYSGVKETQQKVPGEPRQEFTFNECTTVSENYKRSCLHEERLTRDIEVDDEVNGALMRVNESLELIANRTEVPVSFSVPQTQKQVIMQPFVLEESGELMSQSSKKTALKKSFLSSIVFLPVEERLKNSVMVSFKLTPT